MVSLLHPAGPSVPRCSRSPRSQERGLTRPRGRTVISEADPSANKEVDFRDFLVCRGNGNLGLVGRARFPHRTLSDTLFPDTMIAARVNPKQVDRSYLEALWHTKWMRLQIESRSTTTSGIHKINQATLGSLLCQTSAPSSANPIPLSMSSRLRRSTRGTPGRLSGPVVWFAQPSRVPGRAHELTETTNEASFQSKRGMWRAVGCVGTKLIPLGFGIP